MRTKLCQERIDSKGLGFLKSANLLLLALLGTGCPATRTETIIIRGSNTIGEELAAPLIREYRKQRPDVVFDVEFKGTTYGMGALMAGRGDIAAASREATTNELELAKSRAIEFNDYVIGSYSVAVVVNAANPIGNLTPEQVRDIFTGAIRNWKEVGGSDAPVRLNIRDEISGTHLGFQELAMEKKPYALGLRTFTNYAEIVQAVARDAHGIGYTSIDLANQTGVKAVSIGGVAPSAQTVNQGKYPYARVLRFYTNKGTETPVAREFVQFVQSPRGQAILNQMGFVPRP
jgi:phosphate transport system substrate-binding protein